MNQSKTIPLEVYRTTNLKIKQTLKKVQKKEPERRITKKEFVNKLIIIGLDNLHKE